MLFYTQITAEGQNKNRYLMSYLAYRIINKLHTDIKIILMPVGHTKF
jgi:hypothetical protein